MMSLECKNTMGRIQESINTNKIWYIICFFCICTGIVVGIYSVRYMGEYNSKSILELIKENLVHIQGGQVSYKDIIYRNLKVYIPLIAVIWILGFTVISIPFILMINLIKGFTFGFTFGFLVLFLGNKGITGTAIIFICENIIIIILLIIASVASINMTKRMFLKKNASKKVYILKYSIIFVMIIFGIVVESMIQSLTSPIIINSIIRML